MSEVLEVPMAVARPGRRPLLTVAERALVAECPECGQPVARRSPFGPPPTFCSQEHKRAFGNRQLAEGRAVIGLLKAWRIDRGTGPIAKASFAQVCAIVDEFNARDGAAKRPRACLYAAKLLADGTIYADRQRRRPEPPQGEVQ